MTYQQTIEYLYALQPPFHLIGAAAYKPGFDNILLLLQHIGNPHLTFKKIHIAGTNGKGSTSHLIAATLQSANYKTGLYTSPHLVDFCERIKINGSCISQDFVVRFVENNKTFLEHIKPSFFETTTAMAFAWFADQKVDIAVIEVGLGGRLDSTNIIEPELAVITNIGYDHTEFLGNTLQEIAAEKAGIIKPNTPVVIGETSDDITPVFTAKAAQMRAPLIFAEREMPMPDMPCQLQGSYQVKNHQTAFCAIRQLQGQGYHISDADIANGFANVCTLTGLQGRWQIISRQPLTICDTGHNSHAFRYVSSQLNDIKCKRLFIVFGMVADKDVEQVMQLLPQHAHYFFTQANTKRAIPASQLCQMAQHYGLQGEAVESVSEAYVKACRQANNDDAIFVGGSNYVVGEFLSWLKNNVKNN